MLTQRSHASAERYGTEAGAPARATMPHALACKHHYHFPLYHDSLSARHTAIADAAARITSA